MAIPGVPRSQRLLAFLSTSALEYSPVFTCPPDTVTLVKSAHARNAHSVASGITLYLQIPGGVTVALLSQSLAPGAMATWDGWAVLHPGEFVFCQAVEQSLHVWVSGATLRGGPLYPPAELADPLVFPHVPGALPTSI